MSITPATQSAAADSHPPKTSALATASLVLGGGALIIAAAAFLYLFFALGNPDLSSVGALGAGASFLLVAFLCLPASLLAVVLGHIGAWRIRRRPAQLTGAGRARIGLVCGYLCLLVILAAAVVLPGQIHVRR